MKKKTDTDIITLFRDFQKEILDNKPNTKIMFDEVRMMKFKIKPLQGDISLLNFNDTRLIEILWSLGKLDEFFKKEFKRINPHKKRIFFQLFDSVHKQFQSQLGRLSLKSEKVARPSAVLEMEIFKELRSTRKYN